MSLMDYIHIDKLVFRGKHGYFAKERRVEQELLCRLNSALIPLKRA